MKRMTWTLQLALMIGAAVACTEDGTIPAGCEDLGTDGPAQKASAVIAAVNDLTVEAGTLATELEAVCDDMAAELGITPPAPTEEQTTREATCAAVAAEIETILTEASATVTVSYEPAVCTVSVDGYAMCAAECDVDVDAMAEVTCEGGELSGSCSGMCSGSCTVEGSATCMGECSGSCTGSCSGTCTGECDGTCSVTDDEGNCVGTCDGTCMGTCSATCEGSCSGSCTAEVEGSCEGTCTGSCDVAFEAPRCSGDADVMASAECEAACDAELNADLQCTEPRVTIDVVGDGTGRVADLVRTLQRHWPRFLSLTGRIEAAVAAGADVVVAVGELSDVSAAAAICLGTAANAAANAAASLEISVTVTVEVSASASAG